VPLLCNQQWSLQFFLMEPLLRNWWVNITSHCWKSIPSSRYIFDIHRWVNTFFLALHRLASSANICTD
jgi:hypothetical protein